MTQSRERMGVAQQQFIALLDGGPLGSPHAVDKLGEMSATSIRQGFPCAWRSKTSA